MKLLRNKWALIVLGILVLASIALLFRKHLGPIFGGFTKSKRGYYYRFVEGHELEKVKGPGYHVVFQYLLLGPKGDTVENRSLPGVNLARDYPVIANNEIDDMMQVASPGSLVEVLVPTDTLKVRASSNIKVVGLESGKNAKFILKIINILDENEFAEYENKRRLDRLSKEFVAMDEYAAKNKGPWLLDSISFFKYYINNKTDKPRLAFANIAEFNCEVYSLKGDLLVNSGMEGHKFRTTIGSNSFNIEGLEKALEYLAEGEDGVFLVTSDYGFKDRGYLTLVPPYAPLMIRIKDVKKIK